MKNLRSSSSLLPVVIVKAFGDITERGGGEGPEVCGGVVG